MTIYKNDDVEVTNEAIWVAGAVYSVEKVNSVKIGSPVPFEKLILPSLGLLFFGALTFSQYWYFGIGSLILLAALVAHCVFFKSVVIVLSSSEVRAFSSYDEKELLRVFAAVVEAMKRTPSR